MRSEDSQTIDRLGVARGIYLLRGVRLTAKTLSGFHRYLYKASRYEVLPCGRHVLVIPKIGMS